MNLLFNRLLAVPILTIMSIAFADAKSNASEISYFVLQGKSLYELKGSTGGRLVKTQTSGYVNIPNLGQFSIVGYTDRVSRGEQFIAVARGFGPAILSVSYQDQFSRRMINLLGPIPITLPLISPILQVPINARFDNLRGQVKVGNKQISKELPVGTRPSR